MAASVYDFASEQLIAQLLQEDLTLMDSYRQAEKLQLDQVIATSARAQGHIPKYSKDDTVSNNLDTDADIAFELYVSDARVSSDAAYAQTVQNEAFTANTVDMQMAQRMAANERRGRVIRFVIAFEEAIEIEDSAILTTSKGKGRQLSSPPLYQDSRKRIKRESLESLDDFSRMKEGSTSPVGVPYSTCNICLEAFTVTNSPISATLSANSSTKLQFGLCLPCPKNHAYCISCLTSYIESKLDPDGRGVGKSIATVFPIRCPECPLVAWPEGIDDDVARRVLGDHGMTEWVSRRSRRFGPGQGTTLEALPQLRSPATIQGKCKSNPPCELWDEEMLLEARERERNRQAAAQQHIQHAPAPAHVDVAHAIGAYVVPEAPVPVAHHYHLIEHNDDLDWINDPGMPLSFLLPAAILSLTYIRKISYVRSTGSRQT
ncbi:hypothetical protein H0H87_003037 [Tephrocybe sp. NHM501043]|nr:hypothetical protein H0H87_003037 [Tephrocybe sp. NHM501043]